MKKCTSKIIRNKTAPLAIPTGQGSLHPAIFWIPPWRESQALHAFQGSVHEATLGPIPSALPSRPLLPPPKADPAQRLRPGRLTCPVHHSFGSSGGSPVLYLLGYSTCRPSPEAKVRALRPRSRLGWSRHLPRTRRQRRGARPCKAAWVLRSEVNQINWTLPPAESPLPVLASVLRVKSSVLCLNKWDEN